MPVHMKLALEPSPQTSYVLG